MKPEDVKELTPVETAIMMDLHNWFSGLCRQADVAAPPDPLRTLLAISIEAQSTHRWAVARNQLADHEFNGEPH